MANLGFSSTTASSKKLSLAGRLRQPTTGNGNIAVLGANLANYSCPPLSQSLDHNFIELDIKNPELVLGILTLSS